MKVAIINQFDDDDYRIIDVYENVQDITATKNKIDWNSGKIEGEDVLNEGNYVIFPDIDINVDDSINFNFISENRIDPSRFVQTDRVEALEETTAIMQDVDDFTLQVTQAIDTRTADMQGVDDFAMQQLFYLEQRINELEQRIQTLEGGNV